MKLLGVLLLALALPTLAPLAAADHGLCGAADGSIVPDFTLVWLRPGCLGAYAGLPPTVCDGTTLVHGQVLVTQVYVNFCGAGVWLP